MTSSLSSGLGWIEKKIGSCSVVVLIKKKSSNNQQGMSFVVFNQNLQRTKRMSLDKIPFSSHAVGIVHFTDIASFRDILWAC